MFSLERQEGTVLQGKGRYTITDNCDYQDMMYRGGVIAEEESR